MRSVYFFVVIFFTLVEFHSSYSINNNEDLNNHIKYYVYTRENIEKAEIIEPNVESVIRNVLNLLKPITFSIADWSDDKNSPMHQKIITTKLKEEDSNVITVDLKDLKLKNYTEAVEVAPLIGDAIADFIILLHKFFNVKLEEFHLVGFSLGAHIAGFTGQYIQKQLGDKLTQITGLDPSGAIYANATNSDEHLTKDDAKFVEIIHTNANGLGFELPCGHADYYPNGGYIQPGCNKQNMKCSQSRAYELIGEMWSSVNNEFLVTKCKNINQMDLKVCQWVDVKMGYNKNNFGIFYLETNDKYPYGKGSFMVSFL